MKKIVVFDLDETLGFFTDLGEIYDALSKQMGGSVDQKTFNQLLRAFPRYRRPGIMAILRYLKGQKIRKHCDKVMIYTNNQGPSSWAMHIQKYFEDELGYPLFDQIIAAFKVGRTQVEICRTSHSKTVADFIQCTKLPTNTKICFLDDQYHPDMVSDDVYYIRLGSYVYHYTKHEIMRGLATSRIMSNVPDKNSVLKSLLADIGAITVDTKKRDERYGVYKIASKRIMFYLQDFFRHDKTARKKGKRRNKTQKNKNKN
jgi:hypothetical protein